MSRATISRTLTRRGLVTPDPRKRPRSSYIRFQAAMPNETWQSDFTHCRLSTGTDVEVIERSADACPGRPGGARIAAVCAANIGKIQTNQSHWVNLAFVRRWRLKGSPTMKRLIFVTLVPRV